MPSANARREIGNPTSRPVSFYRRCRSAVAPAPVVFSFTLLCVLLRLAENFGGVSLSEMLALQAGRMRDGAFWQPLSYALVHGPWWHLALNAFVLLLTGGTLERTFGSLRFLGLLLAAIPAGAVGFLLSLLWDPRLPVCLTCAGASALSSACFGFIAAAVPRERITLWLLVLPVPFRAGWLLPLAAALLITEALLFPGVTAYGAHLGGWCAGLLAGLLLREKAR